MLHTLQHSYAGTSHVEHKTRSIFEDIDMVHHLEKDSLSDADVQKVTTKVPVTKKSRLDILSKTNPLPMKSISLEKNHL
ncbi:hypothetical protein ANCCAN_17036 [Ancylostoma caninum]|uniref:Uncharacterized protein n=2 Tax=Ancylostoma caninum TaxID=29170 RepID=A0A368FY10_ANCCA|nr:hypothetical protein ANCCAN_17036 [Ancylostoma caninum]